MHPLVARIHPALRTALTAWLLSRVVIWSAASGKSMEVRDGTALAGLVGGFVDGAAAAVPQGLATQLVAFSPWILLEVLVLLAGIAVYRFARSTELPQFAERACWLWFFNPVLAITAGQWGAQMAAACGALAIAYIATYRPRRAIAAALVATGCRLEFLLLWPAFAFAAWRHRHDPRHSRATLALSFGAIPLGFALWIGAAIYFAGSAHISMRAVHQDMALRHSLFPGTTALLELAVVIAVTVAALICLTRLRHFPLWYSLAALPALGWALAMSPATTAAITTAWALPVFVYLACATDDRSLERPLLLAMALAFCGAAFGL